MRVHGMLGKETNLNPAFTPWQLNTDFLLILADTKALKIKWIILMLPC